MNSQDRVPGLLLLWRTGGLTPNIRVLWVPVEQDPYNPDQLRLAHNERGIPEDLDEWEDPAKWFLPNDVNVKKVEIELKNYEVDKIKYLAGFVQEEQILILGYIRGA